MIISVVGNISSGKTTLAKKISSLYNFTYIPSKRKDLQFLDTFFQNIPDHFFSTQTSFLINKISEIDEKNRNINIVIDRSIFEDIHIFAQFWMDNYPIDDNEKELYKNMADYLVKTVPKTDIYIVCRCETSAILDRFDHRERRAFENKYPDNYIQQLSKKYESLDFPYDAVVVEINTEALDVRKDETVIQIMSSILTHINNQNSEQLSFFDNPEETIAQHYVSNPYIKISAGSSNILFSESVFTVKKKQIYLAAPFTEFATEEPTEENSHQLYVDESPKRDYNILPKKYQKLLKKIKKLLSCSGEFDIILPHKQENNWGKTYISNKQVVDAMIANMKNSDLLVAIVSNSIGVHMEVAMMSIQDKPMVLIVVDDLTTGFYANGFMNQSNVLVLHARTIDSVYSTLKNSMVLEFIRRNISDEKMDKKPL